MRSIFHSLALPLLVTGALAAQDRPAPEVTVRVMVLLNGFYTSDSTNNSDLPQFALPPGTGGFPTAGLGGTMRQSRVQARAFLAGVGGGDFSAELDVDFWGGQQPSTGGRTFPLLRIRRAWAEQAWDRFRILVGQEAPPIVELNPTSLASLGISSLAASGNLWLWIPQIRTTGVLAAGTQASVELEGTVLAPTGYTAQGLFLTAPDRAEQSKRPYLQGRVRVRFGTGATAGEMSLGGHVGWLSTSGDSLLTSKAGAVLLKLPLGRRLEIRGEAFAGRGIAGLGGGGIGQNFGPGGTLVRTRGGWGQLTLKPGTAFEFGGSWGMEDPKDADLDPATQRLKNETVVGHFIWRPAPFLLGLEYRHITTTYGPAVGKRSADHLNLAVGAEF